MSAQTRQIEQTLRELRSPGRTARSKRVREFLFLATREERRRSPKMTSAEARERAEARLKALMESPNANAIVREFEATAPTSRTPKREHIDDYVEVAAALRNPVLRWLTTWMLERTNERGPSPDRSMVLSVFFHMAFVLGRPDISNTRKGFRAARPSATWAFGYPGRGPKRSSFYDSMRNMLMGRPASARVPAWTSSLSSRR